MPDVGPDCVCACVCASHAAAGRLRRHLHGGGAGRVQPDDGAAVPGAAAEGQSQVGEAGGALGGPRPAHPTSGRSGPSIGKHTYTHAHTHRSVLQTKKTPCSVTLSPAPCLWCYRTTASAGRASEALGPRRVFLPPTVSPTPRDLSVGRPRRFLVAAGDPLQLPPVIASPATLTSVGGASPPVGGPGPATHGSVVALGSSAAEGPCDSLLRPMFVRLSQLGHQPHLLSYQYRCAGTGPRRCTAAWRGRGREPHVVVCTSSCLQNHGI